ncbi:Sugar transferase involved in LPS biosynthesis (colanic, teichoic acid) [Butyrivibrio hungatei DSM 14810]|uniref:Sugar transferase involved in LPS biosynthesis (Colanic, teichoic acid) n=1 Tax=Butyrivibrio hungatei DSM 14810 TaxID=1121132 RepID=A0A1M7RZN5_9FIRM|nr:sugar transferase [Butyrivibrio hungatei]SHN51787.1 Sugar transferase involved in LPS biosynthesis (colanic, teichoic acid) [Butyrivibrio hungatei DSM 14810]
MKNTIYSKYVKRIIDILLSLVVIVLFFWLYFIVAVLVRVKLGSPVIFRQPRPGKDEKVFNLYKFRTMTDARDKDGNLLPDEDRLPEFGKKLRATSLDELPEFFNILKGDMSFVGPRPLLVKYLPLYNEEQRHRHDVRPGLTGWAQVNGRNLLNWEDRFEKDVFYVNHISFLMDLKIVFMTVAVVFRHNDINSATDATMEAFTGTKPKE